MKKYIVFLFTLLLFTVFSAKSQDTIYNNKQGEEVKARELAVGYTVVSYNKKKGIKVTERTYTCSGQIKSESFYSDIDKKNLEGLKTSWNDNGKIRNQITYQKGKWHGDYISYWPNGNLRRKDNYKQGEFNKGKIWDSTGVQIEYYPLIERAEFPGGQEAIANFLKANVKNPEGKKGKIIVKFVVDKTGVVTKTEIMKSEIPELNEEALRVVTSMPRWKPGKHEGEPVGVFYALPLNFQ